MIQMAYEHSLIKYCPLCVGKMQQQNIPIPEKEEDSVALLRKEAARVRSREGAS
jgi:hypothetical protein